MESMHFRYLPALLCCAFISLFALSATAQNSACFGETVTLQLDSTRGSLQWQKSLDGQSYTDLPGQNAISTQQVITEDAWFRAYHITEAGCDTVWSDVFSIEVNDLRADAGPDQVICQSEFFQLGGSPSATGGFTPYNYVWSPSTDLNDPLLPNPVATPLASRDYILTVTDANGCIAIDTMNVVVNVITTDSVIFSATGASQTFVVPPCITTIRVRMWGSQGSPGLATTAGPPGAGGRGGFVQGFLAVNPGDVITVRVGNQAGFNGGGTGGTSPNNFGGSGGGASDIRLNGSATSNIVAIAGGGGGGGGGGGFISGNAGNGGANNGVTGGNGTSAATPGGTAGLLGTGGTAIAGGTGGTGGTGCGFFTAGPGQVGTTYQGGNGGNTTTGGMCVFGGAGGGGGGGGLFGGAGGGGGAPGEATTFTGAGGGGGAGSSWTGSLTSATASSTTRTGNGEVIISW